MRIRSRAYEVTAIQFTGGPSFQTMLKRFGGSFYAEFLPALDMLRVRVGRKVQECYPGDWVIRTDAGLFFVQSDRYVRENFDTENPIT